MDEVKYSTNNSYGIGVKYDVGGEIDTDKSYDDLNWKIDGNLSPDQIQENLETETLALNIEIMDFLLNWEEDEPKKDQKRHTQTQSSKFDSIRNVRDTSDLLAALTKIDRELSDVDEWLRVQIEHLSGIQSELQQIESENGALETSWHNLTSLKALSKYLIQTLTLTPEEEEILSNPHKTVEGTLRNLVLDQIEDLLVPTLLAANRLKTGLTIKGTVPTDRAASLTMRNNNQVTGPVSTDSSSDFQLTDVQWTVLQGMPVISKQILRLTNVAEAFCKSMSLCSATLFKAVLKHKQLIEPSVTSQGRSSSIIVKKFDVGKILSQLQDSYRTATKILNPFPRGFDNQLIAAQRTFHEAVGPFLPLLDYLTEFSIITPTSSTFPSFAEGSPATLHHHYIEAVRDLLYRPLFRQLFKDLAPITASKALGILSFGTLPASPSTAGTVSVSSNAPPIYQEIYNSNLVVSPTTPLTPSLSLQLVVRLCEAAVSREEAFIEVEAH